MSEAKQEQEESVEGGLAEADVRLMELISDTFPGGIMGSYLEAELPVYMINRRMLELLGYTYEEFEAVTGKKRMKIICPDDRRRVQESITGPLEKNNSCQTEYRIIGKNARLIWVHDSSKKIIMEDGRTAVLSIMMDISERVEKENRLKEEAGHDPLTKLNNRKNMVRLLEKEFQKGRGGYFFIFDVDNFKSINDTRGHAVGDDVLIELARIIQEHAGREGISARLGGDEYIVFFTENLPGECVEKKVRAIQNEFTAYMKTLAPDLEISLSVGGVERTKQETFRELYVKADEALYEAKKRKGELRFRKGGCYGKVGSKRSRVEGKDRV